MAAAGAMWCRHSPNVVIQWLLVKPGCGPSGNVPHIAPPYLHGDQNCHWFPYIFVVDSVAANNLR